MRPSRPDLRVAFALLALVFMVHVLSPNSQPYDSRWSIHTTLSILHHGDSNLDEFLPLLEADGFYHIECVFPDGRRIRRIASADDCAGGHYYHFYPLGVPLIAAPFVAATELALRAGQPLLYPLARHFPSPLHRTFLRGDLIGASALMELLIACFLIALSAALLFLVLREWLSALPAALLALLYAFGTSAWSTGSRALWMHGFSMLLLVAAFWLLRLALPGGRMVTRRANLLWAAAGALLTFAFFVRPTNIVPLAAVGLWMLWKHRAHLMPFSFGALPVLLLFASLHLAVYKAIIPPYSAVQRTNEAGLSLGPHVPVALLGNLVSPSRGLFVFTPVLLFAFAGLWLWFRQRETRDWAVLLGFLFLAHYLLISFYEDWFGGHGYGPRYFADLSPLLILPLAPLVVRPWRWRWGAPLLIAAAISVFMHQQGAWCWPCMRWDSEPALIRESQWRLWDWREPMFLRGFMPKYASNLSKLPGPDESPEPPLARPPQ